jgi:hypothetical protein
MLFRTFMLLMLINSTFLKVFTAITSWGVLGHIVGAVAPITNFLGVRGA